MSFRLPITSPGVNTSFHLSQHKAYGDQMSGPSDVDLLKDLAKLGYLEYRDYGPTTEI